MFYCKLLTSKLSELPIAIRFASEANCAKCVLKTIRVSSGKNRYEISHNRVKLFSIYQSIAARLRQGGKRVLKL